MGHTGPVHFEPLEGPVPGGDCSHETGRNEIPSELHGIERVELGCTGGFFQDLVDPGLQCRVEGLEQVLKEQCEQLARSATKNSAQEANPSSRTYSSRRLLPT